MHQLGKDLIDKIHSLGIPISYDHVFQISKNFANNVYELYEDEPPNLRKHVFTTAAIDNCDHNPSSTCTTASDSFHGIAVSIINHLSDAFPRSTMQSKSNPAKCFTTK